MGVRRIVMSAFMGLSLAALAGCSGPTSIAESSQPGIPDTPAFSAAHSESQEIEPGWITRPFGAWLIEGETFGIVVWGSSACPDIPDSFDVASNGHITIGFALNPGDPCTDDLVPMTHTFALPEAAATHPTTVVVIGPGDREDVVIYLD